MSAFTRSLDVDQLLRHVEAHPESIVASLFENWVPAGGRPQREGKHGLRLALRNGYVNFYVRGQSVAKLTSNARGISVATHWKYHQGVHKGTAGVADGKLYAEFSGTELLALSAQDLSRWVESARTYATAEKTFVDGLLSTDPNIVDLEIALPSASSPRMDLAVVSEAEGKLNLGFWEAKCIDNSELRSSTEASADQPLAGPKVLHQAQRYKAWLENDRQLAALQVAYSETGRTLRNLTSALVTLDGSRFWQLDRLGRLIKALAVQTPDIVLDPGLVVCAKCPSLWLRQQPNPRATSDRFQRNLLTFRCGEDSHEAKLQRAFRHYLCLKEGITRRLPPLTQ